MVKYYHIIQFYHNMSLTYQFLAKKPKLFNKVTTLNIEEFDNLIKKLQPEWKDRELKRLDRPDRKNKIGQGHPYFGTFADMVLLMLVYARTNCSNVLLGILFDISEPTVIAVCKRLLPLMQDRFVPRNGLRKKRASINTLDELLAKYPEITEAIVDGTDIATRRPRRRQKKNYSGKSKKHSKKIVIAVNPKDGIIIGRTKLRPGSVHDKKILDDDSLHSALNKKELIKRADSAWTGEPNENGWKVNKRARRNHPLTGKEKKENKKLSKIRIKVEHALHRIKLFKRIGEKTMFRAAGKMDLVINAAINFANYKQLTRFPAMA